MSITDPRVVDVFLAARDAVGPDTWTQGTMNRDGGGRPSTPATSSRSCVMGHLLRATYLGSGEFSEAITLLVKAADIDTGTLTMWNDDPGRTWQDVWDALDAAASLAKERAS